MDKNRRIRATSLSLNPTIQSLILHMYTMFEDFSLQGSWYKFNLKRQENKQIKIRIRAMTSILNITI